DVVLDDEIVPIEYPHGAIWTYFRMDRAKRFVRTCHQGPAVVLFEAGTIRFDDCVVYQAYGRLSNKGHPIPIALRVIARGIEMVSCRRCKATHHVYLPEVGRHGVYFIMAVYFLHRIDRLPVIFIPKATLYQSFGH